MAFQPLKVQRSELWKTVQGRVLIYIYKGQTLAHVEQRYPARHYGMADGKLRSLAAMKAILRHRLTRVVARQGHYALDPHILATTQVNPGNQFQRGTRRDAGARR